MNTRTTGFPQFLRGNLAQLGRLGGLFAVIALFAFLDYRRHDDGQFLTLNNFMTVGNQAVIVALCAMGMTCVIISAGIDLSVGSVIALSTVVTAILLREGYNPAVAALGGVAAGTLCGLINGLAITFLRIVPFVATLGMMGIARGMALMLGEGQPVRPPVSWLEDLASRRPLYSWMVFSPGVCLLIVSAVAVSIMLRMTIFGRHIYAVGSSEPTARLCGLPVRRIKVQIYALSGFFAGVAGLMQFARLTQGDPTVAAGLELDVIAAVVIGGGSLTGGEGSVSGTIIGALFIQFLRNGCNMLGVDNYVQQIIIGLIIIGAVYIDQMRQRMSE